LRAAIIDSIWRKAKLHPEWGTCLPASTKHLEPINQINRFKARHPPPIPPTIDPPTISPAEQLKFFKGHPQLQLWFNECWYFPVAKDKR